MAGVLSKRRRVAAGAVIAILMGLVGWLLQPDQAPPPPAVVDALASADSETAPVAAADPSITEQAATAVTTPQAAADQALLARWQTSSLRGTEVDGAISFSADGRLIRDSGLRQLIDYFLSLSGEFSDAEIRRLLAMHLQARYGDTVTDAVLATFDQYLGMRNELAGVPATGDLRDRFAAIRSIRERWFGADSEAMFGSEHAQVALTLERQTIANDTSLTPAQREQRLAAWDAARPQAQRAAEASALSAELAEQQTGQMDAMQMDADSRFVERSELWGEEAAQRLADLDLARQQWDQRLGDYRRARDRIMLDPSLSALQRQSAIDALRRSGFSANEQVRIESLEAIEQLPDGG